MDVAYAFLNHHHSIWINGEQFCIWHSYFTDNMQNIFTYTHIDCLIYRKGEKNDAKNAPFTWTRTEPKAENLVQLIESKVSFVVPFNSDCELRLCRARFSQESLGMFRELRGIGHWNNKLTHLWYMYATTLLTSQKTKTGVSTGDVWVEAFRSSRGCLLQHNYTSWPTASLVKQ